MLTETKYLYIRPGAYVASQLEAREGTAGSAHMVAKVALGRYFALIEDAGNRIATALSREEVGTIADALQDTPLMGPREFHVLPGIVRGNLAKAGIERPELLAKLDRMSGDELMALLDRVEIQLAERRRSEET